jgi:hypothetical protein
MIDEDLETRMQRIMATLTVAPAADYPNCLLITGLDEIGEQHMAACNRSSALSLQLSKRMLALEIIRADDVS